MESNQLQNIANSGSLPKGYSILYPPPPAPSMLTFSGGSTNLVISEWTALLALLDLLNVFLIMKGLERNVACS